MVRCWVHKEGLVASSAIQPLSPQQLYSSSGISEHTLKMRNDDIVAADTFA